MAQFVHHQLKSESSDEDSLESLPISQPNDEVVNQVAQTEAEPNAGWPNIQQNDTAANQVTQANAGPSAFFETTAGYRRMYNESSDEDPLGSLSNPQPNDEVVNQLAQTGVEANAGRPNVRPDDAVANQLTQANVLFGSSVRRTNDAMRLWSQGYTRGAGHGKLL